MAIKSTISQDHSSSQFPKLMRSSTGNNLVVLFSEHSKGMVVFRGTSQHDMGHYTNDWSMGSFSEYRGSVTLTSD